MSGNDSFKVPANDTVSPLLTTFNVVDIVLHSLAIITNGIVVVVIVRRARNNGGALYMLFHRTIDYLRTPRYLVGTSRKLGCLLCRISNENESAMPNRSC